jgi:ADP-ribose pyrophosphatase YjhB (NUDIX family)
MGHAATDDAFRRAIARALEFMPADNETPISPEALAAQVSQAQPDLGLAGAEDAVWSALRLLRVFGAVREVDGGYRTAGRSAGYFARSLAWYVAHDVPITERWRHHQAPGDAPEEPAWDLLRRMEERRVALAPRYGAPAQAVRQVSAVQILIKAVRQGAAHYLHQFDIAASQYQLIGGRVEVGEAPARTAERELAEEIAISGSTPVALTPLTPSDAPIRQRMISKTYGALTDYTFHVFAADVRGHRVHLGPRDAWISVDDMLGERRPGGRPLGDIALVREIDAQIPGGLRAASIAALNLDIPEDD